MRSQKPRWKLEDVIDFEQALVSRAPVSEADRARILAASRGLDGPAARRAGLFAWLEQARKKTPGRKFTGTLAWIGGGLALLLFLAGISGVIGLVDRERGGVNVTLFLGILLGVQWLVLAIATLAWLFRSKATGGFSAVQALIGKLAKKWSGEPAAEWWGNLMEGGGAPRAALLWRLARLAQIAGISFNLGILTGLGGLVLLRHLAFFWETTTAHAMHTVLEDLVRIMALPWSWWPGAVPDAAVITGSRWLPGRALPPGPAEWWRFLLMSTIFWGLLPRAALWWIADRGERNALRKLDFQSRAARTLWREAQGNVRQDLDEKPLDGVLVLDVGGSGLSEASLRSFLLQKLRVHPAGWHSVAVLTENAAEIHAAIEKVPAGVVLLGEGWSLSPPRMTALHSRIRTVAEHAPIKFLAVNAKPDGQPAAVTEEEKKEWERFVDSLRDPFSEVHFYTEAQAVA